MRRKNLRLQESYSRRAFRIIAGIGIAALLLGIGTVALAQAVSIYTPAMSATVGDFVVDLINYTVEGDESTWSYAVTWTGADGDGKARGLSHLTFAVDPGCTIIDPATDGGGQQITTPTTFEYCDVDGNCEDLCLGPDGYYYECIASQYDAISSEGDPTTGISGPVIKWESAEGAPQLDSTDQTHIFMMRVLWPNQVVGTTTVGVKYGGNQYTEPILGPICPPTAVSFAATEAKSGSGIALLGLALAGGIFVAGTTGYNLKRKRRGA